MPAASCLDHRQTDSVCALKEKAVLVPTHKPRSVSVCAQVMEIWKTQCSLTAIRRIWKKRKEKYKYHGNLRKVEV